MAVQASPTGQPQTDLFLTLCLVFIWWATQFMPRPIVDFRFRLIAVPHSPAERPPMGWAVIVCMEFMRLAAKSTLRPMAVFLSQPIAAQILPTARQRTD